MTRLVPLLLVLVGLSACSEPDPEPTSTPTAVAARVAGVGIDRRSDTPVVVLEEIGGDGVLPIWIGASEARSIQAVIEAIEWPRPNTHDLTRELLLGLDAAIERVTVTELRGSTYYAVVRIVSDRTTRELDARPSDAIALALRFDAPVFVARSLFTPREQDDDAPPPSGDDGIQL
jgi:bifunctional DNase/RNase